MQLLQERHLVAARMIVNSMHIVGQTVIGTGGIRRYRYFSSGVQILPQIRGGGASDKAVVYRW